MDGQRARFVAQDGVLPCGDAQFALDGKTCLIIDDTSCGTVPNAIGSLALNGRCYVILVLPDEPPRRNIAELLSPRELEIALHVAAGSDCKMVARRLRISFHTVRVHLGRIYAKLGLHKQTELAALITVEFGRRIADRPHSSGEGSRHLV
jgi:DNA-binding CsgD family transcriptional regulator